MLPGVVFLYVIWIVLAVLSVWIMVVATRDQEEDDHHHLPH